jgi:N-acylneuraminate cytidylyltransferase
LLKPFPALNKIHTVAFDFDGVFTDNKVWLNQNGHEMVRCDRADGLAFDFIRAFKKMGKLDAEFFVLSKEPNPVVLARTKKLKLKCHHGIADKLSLMRGHLAKRFPSMSNFWDGVVYLGNDLNDLPLMRQVGYAVAPADAHPKVLKIAHLVLKQNGGEGFVRAFIERMLGIDKLSKENLDELISHC